MNIRLQAQLALDTLPFAATREGVLAAIVDLGERAFEAGRLEGRFDILAPQSTADEVPS